MRIQDLKDLIEIARSLDSEQPSFPSAQIGALGRKVIVRSRDAGVLFGEYAGNEGSTVHLRNGVQMWKWTAARGISLIDVATYGVKASECRFSLASATVTVFSACALIDVTDTAAASIEELK